MNAIHGWTNDQNRWSGTLLTWKTQSGVVLWSGVDPSCFALYTHLQAFLRSRQATLLPPGATLTNSQRGNLGEFIAFVIGHQNVFASPPHRIVTNNAYDPLSGISMSGLDIAYVHFHPTDPQGDMLFIQEVSAAPEQTDSYLQKLVGSKKQKGFATVEDLPAITAGWLEQRDAITIFQSMPRYKASKAIPSRVQKGAEFSLDPKEASIPRPLGSLRPFAGQPRRVKMSSVVRQLECRINS